MQVKDYYDILGVSRDATDKEIKAAYRKLARQHHPDANAGDKAAEEKFKEINEAHEVLADPDKRKKYDAFGADWQRYQQAGGAAENYDFRRWASGSDGARTYVRYGSAEDFADMFNDGDPFSDFFSTLFGGGAAPSATQRGPAQARRGQDLEAPVRVSFQEAFSGTTRLVTLGDRRIEASLPAGVRTGSRVRLAGQGGTGAAGGPGGDLYLVVEVEPDSRFERRGDDLYADTPIDFYTAALGGEARVVTPEGAVSLKIPARTQAGRTFRLKGKGMPIVGGHSRGDLYARIQIVLPDDLSAAEEQALRGLAAKRGGAVDDE